jgi:DNA-dependent protein kinase catalytic subunit
MIKALELGHFNNSLAVTCIQTLERWFNALPVSQTAELYSDIVPKLSYFLTMENRDSETQNSLSGNDLEETVHESFFFQNKIQDSKEETVERSEIANKVLDLLGKIGGHAHSLINNELSKKHDKENYIRWDPEKRLNFTVPLHSSKIDIYLDSCLPRIVDLAQNSNDKETRIAACELLHALILYMIGQSATT